MRSNGRPRAHAALVLAGMTALAACGKTTDDPGRMVAAYGAPPPMLVDAATTVEVTPPISDAAAPDAKAPSKKEVR
jgi:predicted lipoprotein